METYKNLKKGTKVGLIISFVFVTIGFIISVYSLCTLFDSNKFSAIRLVRGIINLAIYVCIALYALIGYKKPHGNLLRNIFLIFSVLIMATLIFPYNGMDTGVLSYVEPCVFGLSAVLTAFVGGRLNKIERNRVLMTIIGCLLLIASVIEITAIPVFSLMSCVRCLAQPIGWAALCLTYTARFEQHKAAGLEDKK